MEKGFFDNPFGGLFDFNGDGKEDLFEQLMGLEILDGFEDDDSDDDDLFDSDDDFDSDNEQDLNCSERLRGV